MVAISPIVGDAVPTGVAFTGDALLYNSIPPTGVGDTEDNGFSRLPPSHYYAPPLYLPTTYSPPTLPVPHTFFQLLGERTWLPTGNNTSFYLCRLPYSPNVPTCYILGWAGLYPWHNTTFYLTLYFDSLLIQQMA